MAARGYTTPALVAAQLGVAFTPEQATAVDALIAAAEVAIDRYVGRAWLVPSPVGPETHRLRGDRLTLVSYPVTAVTVAEARSAAIGAAWRPLVAGTDYELLDSQRGLVSVRCWPSYDVVVNTTSYPAESLARFTYTVPQPLAVPLDVGRAATLTVADWAAGLAGTGAAAVGGASRVSVAQGDVVLEYPDSATAAAAEGVPPIPPLAASLLRSYRGLVVV